MLTRNARTLRQVPRSVAARFAPSDPAADTRFPPCRHIMEAGSPAEVAGIVLRLPDAVIGAQEEALQSACRAAGCGMAADYLALRTAAASALREPDGRLPEHVAGTLEIWRRGLVAIAGGMAP